MTRHDRVKSFMEATNASKDVALQKLMEHPDVDVAVLSYFNEGDKLMTHPPQVPASQSDFRDLHDGPIEVEHQQNYFLHPERNLKASGPELDWMPDHANDIEEDMIRSAIKASKREIVKGRSTHPIGAITVSSGPRVQTESHAEDIDFEHAVSLSLKVVAILVKENYTLKEHLDLDEIIRECQALSGRAITFFIDRLFHFALGRDKSKSVLGRSLAVCISLLDPKRATTIDVADMVEAMLNSVGSLLELLDVSPLLPSLEKHQLKVVELISVLLATRNKVAEYELIHQKAIKRVLQLLSRYPQHTMLHHYVYDMIETCFRRNDTVLTEHLFGDCELYTIIEESQKKYNNLATQLRLPFRPHSLDLLENMNCIFHTGQTKPREVYNTLDEIPQIPPRIGAHYQAVLPELGDPSDPKFLGRRVNIEGGESSHAFNYYEQASFMLGMSNFFDKRKNGRNKFSDEEELLVTHLKDEYVENWTKENIKEYLYGDFYKDNSHWEFWEEIPWRIRLERARIRREFGNSGFGDVGFKEMGPESVLCWDTQLHAIFERAVKRIAKAACQKSIRSSTALTKGSRKVKLKAGMKAYVEIEELVMKSGGYRSLKESLVKESQLFSKYNESTLANYYYQVFLPSIQQFEREQLEEGKAPVDWSGCYLDYI